MTMTLGERAENIINRKANWESGMTYKRGPDPFDLVKEIESALHEVEREAYQKGLNENAAPIARASWNAAVKEAWKIASDPELASRKTIADRIHDLKRGEGEGK